MLCALLALVAFLSVTMGSRSIGLPEVLSALGSLQGDGSITSTVTLELRVPRTLLGILVGAALGVAGAILQGVTRNPLADAGIMGVNLRGGRPRLEQRDLRSGSESGPPLDPGDLPATIGSRPDMRGWDDVGREAAAVPSGGGMRRSEAADDPAWFRRLYDDHVAAILAYGLRRCRERGDAADLAAEVFLVAWRRRPDVPADGTERLWLFGVAKGVLANQRRGAFRRAQLAERLRAELGAAARPSPPDRAAERVADALSTLPDGDRELLQLSVWDELSPAEIAALEGIPAVTVRSRLHRARARLRVALAERELAAAPAPLQTTDRGGRP